MQFRVGLDAEVHVGLVGEEIGIVPVAPVFRIGDVQAEQGFCDLCGRGDESFGEIAAGSEDEVVREDSGRIQVPGGDAAHDPFVQGGGGDFVAHQESASQYLETPFQQHLGADAGDRRRHRAHEGDAGGQGSADLVQHGRVLEAEYLGQDNEILVLMQDADVPDDLLPVLVHGTGDVD